MKSLPARLRVVVEALPFLLWPLVYFSARLALEQVQFEPWLRVTVALAPLLPFGLFLVALVAHIRRLDELHRRVHLEALSIAFPLTLFLVMTLGLLELVIELSPEDWSYRHLWPYWVGLYFVGLAVAWRRYK